VFTPEQFHADCGHGYPQSAANHSEIFSDSWPLSCNHYRVEQPLTSRNPRFTADDPFKVLIADDQEGIIHALQFLLRTAGMEVHIAHSPNEVLSQIGAERGFDLLLMDMNYGRDTTSGQEGLELVDTIRVRDPHLQIVVMTAWSTIDLAVASLQRGAADFLQKPWDNDIALKIVERQASLTRANRVRASQLMRANEDALEVQQALMGAAHKSYGRFSVSGATRAANLVGGDYFDSFSLSESEFVFCIADSMGKGTGAALAMANLQAQVRFEAMHAASPAEVCGRLNRRMFESRLQRLTTMFYGLVDARDGSVRYTNAGHSPAFILKQNGSVERLHSDDALLGAIPSWSYHEGTARLEAGDRLIAVTDGLLESCDAEGNEIGEEGLLQRALACRHEFGAVMLKQILEDALQHCGERPKDDTTALVLSVDEVSTSGQPDIGAGQ
jgi:sigma-B regulation protein RsbU (phosphoserine phosphatase)